jgi:hypothetical protein
MPNTKGHSTATKRATRKIIQGIPSIRSLSKKNCPPGMIRRRSYTRKYSTAVRSQGFTVKKSGKAYRVLPKATDMYVESGCIKNTGLVGKGPKLFGPLRKGELAKYGYSFKVSESGRHAALKKAVNAYGATGVFHKLDAVAKLTKRTSPKAHAVFSEDREWVRKTIPLSATKKRNTDKN